MKNKLFGIVILGVGIVLAGCGSQKQEQNQMPEQENTQQQSSVISSIKDAMDLGKKMKCEYSVDENGNAVKAASYVEGKKFKSTISYGGAVNNTFFDGETTYIWTEGQTTGMKMTESCIKKFGESLPQGQENVSGQMVRETEEHFNNAVDVKCVQASDSVDFSAPSDVTFSDQCEMLEKSAEIMKNINIPGNLPQ